MQQCRRSVAISRPEGSVQYVGFEADIVEVVAMELDHQIVKGVGSLVPALSEGDYDMAMNDRNHSGAHEVRPDVLPLLSSMP